MKKRVIKALSELFLIVLIAALLALPLLWVMESLPTKTYALDDGVFETRDVLDDLLSSEIATDGESKPFDITDFPKDPTARSPKLLNVVEYCYSVRRSIRQYYGLYLYVYNPQAIDFEESSVQNKVELATKYKEDGTPDGYEKFDLRFCSKSTAVDYENVFYKYKVVDRETENGGYILDRVDKTDLRRYDISGFELLTRGANNAEDYKVGGTYTFTGYSKGCGGNANAESDLSCRVNDLETIELNVGQTYWRSDRLSALGKGHLDNLNSAYFSVDNRILKEYGKLQKITASWYEYKTVPAVITIDSAFRDGFLPYVGKNIGEKDSSVPYTIYSNKTSQSLGNGHTSQAYEWSYNIGSNVDQPDPYYSQTTTAQLPFVFYVSGSSDNLLKAYVPSEEVLEYIYNYNASSYRGKLPCKTNSVSADLFLDTVDSGRTYGYNYKTFDTDDKFNILSYDSTHSGFQKYWDYFGKPPKTDGNFENISPIQEITTADLLKDNFDDEFFINSSDYGKVKEYCLSSIVQGQTPFLFRYAFTDYYYRENVVYRKTGESPVKDKAYIAQQTVFLDFDIIELTFNKDGVYHTIPVVSSPVDVANGFSPPLERKSCWDKLLDALKWIFTAILIVVIVVIAFKLLKVIFRFFGWLFRSKRKKNQ